MNGLIACLTLAVACAVCAREDFLARKVFWGRVKAALTFAFLTLAATLLVRL